MKKLLMILFFLFVITGCGSEAEEENVAMKCQKANDYEFYNSTHIIGVYNTKEGEVTKLEFMEVYLPKWEDVDTGSLQKELDTRKANLDKKYENVSFTVDKHENDITSDYVIPLTEKNLNQMKKEDSYKSAIKGDLFSIADYWTYLEGNGYVCE